MLKHRDVLTNDMACEEVFSLDLVDLLSAILSYHHGLKVMSEELSVGCQVQSEMPVKYLGEFIKWLSTNPGSDCVSR